MLRATLISLVAALAWPAIATAAHVTAELVADRTAVEPGGQATVAIVFTVQPHWHIYWLNPGDTGVPPKVRWTLPPGVTVSTPRFPVPTRIDVGSGLIAFGYEDHATLLTTVTLPADAKDAVDLQGVVSVVVCADECILEKHPVALHLGVGRGSPNAADRFARWQAALPRPTELTFEATLAADGKSGSLDFPLAPGQEPLDFFPPPAAFAAYDKPMVVTTGQSRVYRVPFRVLPGIAMGTAGTAVVVTQKNAGGRDAVEVHYTYKLSNEPSH